MRAHTLLYSFCFVYDHYPAIQQKLAGGTMLWHTYTNNTQQLEKVAIYKGRHAVIARSVID